jgi:hypothetical protein
MVQFDSAQLVLGTHGFLPDVELWLYSSGIEVNREGLSPRAPGREAAASEWQQRGISRGTSSLIWTFGRFIEKYDANSVGVFGYHRRQNLDDNRRIEKEGWAHH